MLTTNFGMMDGRELWTDMLDEVPKTPGFIRGFVGCPLMT